MTSPIIGGLNEKSLHRQLKELYCTKGSIMEAKVSGYVIDIVRPDELVEIQTGNFSAMRNKLACLLTEHRVLLVYPIAAETMISTYNEDGHTLRSRRRSPKKGSLSSAAAELLYLAELLPHPNLSVEILLVKQEEVRRDDGNGSWRRKGVSIEDRVLLEVEEIRHFSRISDYLTLLPAGIGSSFDNKEVATGLTGINKRGKVRLAGQITYLLRKLELIEITGKEGNRLLFTSC
ncbi:MAG: hypothetical protein JEZ04_02935 [Spirochaetales bacterium]|nr:hypothetical protein [Spirochaetales bacterium]